MPSPYYSLVILNETIFYKSKFFDIVSTKLLIKFRGGVEKMEGVNNIKFESTIYTPVRKNRKIEMQTSILLSSVSDRATF